MLRPVPDSEQAVLRDREIVEPSEYGPTHLEWIAHDHACQHSLTPYKRTATDPALLLKEGVARHGAQTVKRLRDDGIGNPEMSDEFLGSYFEATGRSFLLYRLFF